MILTIVLMLSSVTYASAEYLPKNPTPQEPLKYRDGRILTEPVKLFGFFYGPKWKDSGKREPLVTLMEGITSTGFLNYINEYKDKDGKVATDQVEFMNQTLISNPVLYGKPHVIENKEKEEQKERQNAKNFMSFLTKILDDQLVKKKTYPIEEGAVYAVFLDETFKTHSGGAHYCLKLRNGKRILAIAMRDFGDITPPTVLDAQFVNKPTNKPGVDQMSLVFVHEIVETILNPYDRCDDSGKKGYFDDSGKEPADKCNFYPGRKFKNAPNGRPYNLKIDNEYYLVQQMWSNKEGRCTEGIYEGTTEKKSRKDGKKSKKKTLEQVEESEYSSDSADSAKYSDDPSYDKKFKGDIPLPDKPKRRKLEVVEEDGEVPKRSKKSEQYRKLEPIAEEV